MSVYVGEGKMYLYIQDLLVFMDGQVVNLTGINFLF